MDIAKLIDKIKSYSNFPAVVYQGKTYTYSGLAEQVEKYVTLFAEEGICPGDVVRVNADYSPASLSTLLALLQSHVIIMPLTNVTEITGKEYEVIVSPEFNINITPDQQISVTRTGLKAQHFIIQMLRDRNHPGLIVMSSGSTGKSKAIVHDLLSLIESVSSAKKRSRVISFLLFDHIGGINTILNAFVSGNCLVVPEKRIPENIAKTIIQQHVDVLITSPSFLNLMRLKGIFERYDLTCLRQVNYGSEVMPETLLKYLCKTLPKTRLNQAYGLSELGVIRIRSDKVSSSLVRIQDPGVQYRVIDNKLQILSRTAMLGYLNAPNPFTEDGWFMTGDVVEIEGDAIRILGRDSEMINVGGEKVFPAEVEEVLSQLSEVEDTVVQGEPNAILGNIVMAKIKLLEGVRQEIFEHKVRQFCRERLPAFKVPQKILFVDRVEYGNRFKKNRNMI